MKSRRIVVVSVLAMAAATTAFAAGSRQDSEADEAVAYEQVKMTLADAIALAERQTGGKAVEATLEQEHGTVSLRLGVPLRPEDQHRGDTHQSLAGEGRPWSGRRADPDGPRVGVHPACACLGSAHRELPARCHLHLPVRRIGGGARRLHALDDALGARATDDQPDRGRSRPSPG